MKPLLLLCLLLASPALAHPGGHGPEDGHPNWEAPPPTPIEVPDTYVGLIGALRGQHETAAQAVKNDRIVTLYRACKRIVELAGAVPAKAEGLGETAWEEAGRRAMRIRAEAPKVKNAASDGDKAAARAALKGILEEIDALGKLVE